MFSRRFKSFGMLNRVDWQILTGVSKDPGDVILKAEQPRRPGLREPHIWQVLYCSKQTAYERTVTLFVNTNKPSELSRNVVPKTYPVLIKAKGQWQGENN
jgi:hypothetical protein